LLDDSLNEKSVPGGAIVIKYGSSTLLEHYSGVSDKKGTKVGEGTLFRIASVSKVFPALLMYILADAGHLDLDAPLSSKIPFSIKNAFDSSPVTFRHLASHLSGLQREAPFGVNTTAEVLSALSRSYLILPPGTLPSYSNLGLALLAHTLAEAVSTPPTTFTNLTQTSILSPLSLLNTGFFYTPLIMEALATGFDALGNPVPFSDLGWWYPAGSMYSTPRDLTSLAQSLMTNSANPSFPLSLSRIREFFSPVFWNRDGASLMGTPWEFRASHSHLQLTKGGNLPGYTSSLALVPTLNLSLAVSWNGNVDEVSFVDSVFSALLPELDGALSNSTSSYNPGPSPADYIGEYALGDSKLRISMTPDGELLWHEYTELSLSFFLEWFLTDPDLGDLFRVAFPDSAFTCLIGELEALRYQLVIFKRDCDSGKVTASSIPGWIPGAEWTRVDCPGCP